MAPLYFLVYCVFTSALVSGQSIRYGLVGLEVNLKPDISGQPDYILWKHNGNKVVEFDGKEEQVYGSYAGRVTLNWILAELRIRDLRYEDSGEYELEVFMNKLLHSRFTVEVIDKVSKPTISCQINEGSSSYTPKLQATLMCSADSRRPQSLMKFEWIPMQPGPKLTIPLRNKQDDEVYSCRVSNPLSQETANFIAKDCYPDESSNVPLVASICALVILFTVLVVLGICCCKRQHKACFAKREGSDGRTDLSDEMRPLFHRAPTYPSPQKVTQDERPLEDHAVNVKKLVEKFEPTNAECTLPPDTSSDKNTDTNKETVPPPVSLGRKPSFGQDSNNLPSNEPGDKDAEQLIESTEETIPKPNSSDSGTEQDPSAVQDHDEDEPSDLQSPTASERPGNVEDLTQFYESIERNVEMQRQFYESLECECTLPPDTSTGSDESIDLSDENRPLFHRAPTCPSPQKLTQDERPLEESVKADEDKESLEDTDSDQVTGEPAEESDRESDSSDLEKINGPHDSSEEKQSSTVPEEKGSEITVHEQDSNLPQHETHTQEDKHQEMNKLISRVRNESENDTEDVAKELTSSQLPQIPTEPENHNTDTAHTQADKEKGDKTRHESDASEVQSDNSTAEANQGEGESEAAENDDQCDQNKEQEVYSESEGVKTTELKEKR